jgi:hypothetical protein
LLLVFLFFFLNRSRRTSQNLFVSPLSLRELDGGLRQQSVPQGSDRRGLPLRQLVRPVGPAEDLDREGVRGEAVVEGGEELDGDVDGGSLAGLRVGELAQRGVEVGTFFFFFFF